MPKVKVSSHYTLSAQISNEKQLAGNHSHLAVEAQAQSLVTRVISGAENGIQLLGNRIKLSNLNFDEASNLLWLEKSNVPYLTERGMVANEWFNLYEHAKDVTKVFAELPDKIIDYPAASCNTNRTLEFAVCIPMDEGMFYLHARQTVENGVCTFFVHQCGTLSEESEQKYDMMQIIGTSNPMPVAEDLIPVEVNFDSAKIYLGEMED